VADLFGVRVTGPLQAHSQGFSEQLTELGYTRLSAADQLRLMAHLSRWLASRGLGAGQLTPQRAEQFLRARRRAGHASRLSQRGLTPLLGYLRGQGVTPQPMPAASTPVQQMVGDYRIYLAQERGLAAGTIRRYVRDAGLFAPGRPGLGRIPAVPGPGDAGTGLLHRLFCSTARRSRSWPPSSTAPAASGSSEPPSIRSSPG
jgi:integrase/recombinase XerD